MDADELFGSDQYASRISNGHRILDTCSRDDMKLYDQHSFDRNAIRLPYQVWIENILASIRQSTNDTLSTRLLALIKRTRKNLTLYNAKHAGPAELITEFFFDKIFFKVKEAHFSKQLMHHKIRSLLQQKKPLSLCLPLFSWKPVSPVKNAGYLPDFAEIASLARCYKVAHILSEIYPHEVRFNIYADGSKYRRACFTPHYMVAGYQKGMHYWNQQLGTAHLVNIIDYESAVLNAIGREKVEERKRLYHNRLRELTDKYTEHFDPHHIMDSIERVRLMDSTGEQIAFTLLAILSIVYYKHETLALPLLKRDDAASQFYLFYLQSITKDIRIMTDKQIPSQLHGDYRTHFRNIMIDMRIQAWFAALKYAATSITDRRLDMWNKIDPDQIKLTIHGKAGEIKFITTNSACMTLTAQHTVGGIRRKEEHMKADFIYRIERETKGERPVMLDGMGGILPPDSPLMQMYTLRQPICYVDQSVSIYELLHDYLDLD